MKNLTLSIDILLLFCAFLYGNLFAMNYSGLNWGFLLIFCVVFFLEFVNKILYFFWGKHRLQGVSLPPKQSFGSHLGQRKQTPLPFTKNRVNPKIERLRKVIKTANQNTYFFYTFLSINTLKRGFILGFFLEAFKVGS